MRARGAARLARRASGVRRKSSGSRGLPVPSRPRVEVFSACTRRLGAMRPMQSRRQRRKSVPREAMCAGERFMSRSIIMKCAVRPTNHASAWSFALAIGNFSSAPANAWPGVSTKSPIAEINGQSLRRKSPIPNSLFCGGRREVSGDPKILTRQGKNVARQE